MNASLKKPARRPARRTRPRRVSVVVADDHPMFLEGVKQLLKRGGFRILGAAGDGEAAVRLVTRHRPDVVLLDVAMPKQTGVEASREILRRFPGLGIVLLTGTADDHVVREALRLGVRGCVVKSQVAEDLFQAIRHVCRGGSYISPSYGRVVRDAVALPEPLGDSLSPRELEVLTLIAAGKSTKQAAALLGISVKTTESHRTSLMEKLDIHEIAGLVRYAIRRGLIDA